MNDLRFALRQLLKNPGFTAVAVITLALGIGANTIIFGLINSVLFKPVMAKRPEQLVSLYQKNEGGKNPGQWRHFSYPDFVDLRADRSVFPDLAAVDFALVGVRDKGLNEMVPTVLVSANYFSLLGISPILGRGFQPEEETSAAPVAVLTHAFFERLGGDPAIIGQTLKLSQGFATIVGVMPKGFTGDRLSAPAFFLSLRAEEKLNSQPGLSAGRVLTDRAHRQFSITGRLRDGLTVKTAGPALSVLTGHFSQADPKEAQNRQLVCAAAVRFDYHEQPEPVAGQVLPLGLLAQGMTLLVLFIACLNLANMMLARGAARQKEIAIRLSLGAGRRRILRQLLKEGLVLAALGGAAGVLVSAWAAHLVGSVVAGRLGVELPSGGSIVDWRLFGATSAFSVLATLFFALGPALKLSRLDFNSDLKGSSDGASAHGKDLLGVKNLVAIGQIGLVTTMLVAAALFARSAMNAVGANPGFEIGANFVVRLDERSTGDTEAQARDFIREASDRVAALPGVESVSPALRIPTGPARSAVSVWPGAIPPGQSDQSFAVTYNKVGMNYFHTLGLPLLGGREFIRAEVETTNAASSVIISQKLAKQHWPDADPIGQTIQLVDDPSSGFWRTATVVGVVPDVVWNILEEQPPAELYEPPAGHFLDAWNLHVRLAPGASAVPIMSACSETLSRFDNRIPFPQIHTLKSIQRLNPQIVLMEAGGLLFGVLGVVAVILSCLGVYGLKAYEVSRRTREIGIRMALGASSGKVLGVVLRESAGLALLGLGLGLPLSLTVSLLAHRFLYKLPPADPLILAGVPLLLLSITLVACLIPARRAARVNPMVALRTE